MNKLLEEIEDINKTLNESEEIVNHWVPTKDIPVDSIPSYLDDTRVRVLFPFKPIFRIEFNL